MKDLLLVMVVFEDSLISPVRLRDPIFLLGSGREAASSATVSFDLSNRPFERSLCKDEACHALGRRHQRNYALGLNFDLQSAKS